ncbi:hypothetical protein DSO57_1007360 [Entomophthora muscae]|uniref:Uncharacterized protein n=1 Tax=Entomophthora muscae TaxID=34485 RepID=A0ACC2RYQ3_9FUNG|nr:hypothetical protein DSO57_1007360 [Entomophthora muscae]
MGLSLKWETQLFDFLILRNSLAPLMLVVSDPTICVLFCGSPVVCLCCTSEHKNGAAMLTLDGLHFVPVLDIELCWAQKILTGKVLALEAPVGIISGKYEPFGHHGRSTLHINDGEVFEQ